METEYEARKEKAAEEAALRIKRGDHWLDWVAVGDGLTVGRLRSMRRAGTNQPVGAAYNRAFGLWLDEHKWARELNKATRNHAMWIIDHRDEIERWRETLAKNQRDRINHPTTMKRAFEAANKDKDKDKTPKEKSETAAQKMAREIDRLEKENDTLRKRVETGSLFDIGKDTADAIISVMTDSMVITENKATKIAKGILAAFKARHKPAG
jgi:hypothetical protein